MYREHAPSIIFMDEIDSIGSSRIESGSGGDSEVQRTMLELLNQLDGFEATKNIKVIDPTAQIFFLKWPWWEIWAVYERDNVNSKILYFLFNLGDYGDE